jgi:hypothetical protein
MERRSLFIITSFYTLCKKVDKWKIRRNTFVQINHQGKNYFYTLRMIH